MDVFGKVRQGWAARFACLTVLAAFAASPAAAVEDLQDWLPPGSKIETTLTERPARWIESEMKGGQMGYLARLGELVFRSPLTLGRDAARRGISCDTCHPNGATNVNFFVSGASDRPGNVDVSHAAFHYRQDDGLRNPVNIPSLRGVRFTAPYGRDGRFPDLRQFSRNVIMIEFGGPAPPEWQLDAMTAYMHELSMPPNERRFAAIPGLLAYNRHCVQCHAGARDFAQGHRWDVGTGGYFEAPSLIGLAETAPYLHDGSAATVRDAVLAHVDAMMAHPVSAEDLEGALRYVEALGAVDRRYDPETLPGDTERLKGFLEVLNQPLLDEDAERADLIADMVAMEIGRIFRRFDQKAATARGAITEWGKALKRAADEARERDFPGARAEIWRLKQAIDNDLPLLRTEIALSLYGSAGTE
ncbi:MAG: hypothetical protein ACMVY4_19300 [Minwuia sp.]|uniref:hypothetical protein n=1 Tax=Minwuia sp. TaxID=2493630 RepID=UPI003A86C33B